MSPVVRACISMFPIAVASTGPADTGIPVALAVSWLSSVLRQPPPMICNFSIGAGVSLFICSMALR